MPCLFSSAGKISFEISQEGFVTGFIQRAFRTFQTHLDKFLADPVFVLLHGTSYHLWFFPALMTGLLIVAPFLTGRRKKLLLPLTLFLFAAGWIIGHTSLALHFERDFQWGNNPFYPPLFLALGALFAGREKPFSAPWALAILVFGIVCRFLEIFIAPYHPWFAAGPVSLSTVPLGAGVFLLALAVPEDGRSAPLRPMAALGCMALGIYAIHPAIARALPYKELLKEAGSESFVNLTFPVYLFAFSLLACYGLCFFRATRWLVCSGPPSARPRETKFRADNGGMQAGGKGPAGAGPFRVTSCRPKPAR